ncbi:ammonia-dependent NAD(+) synthetase (plasmid) [Pseudomonas sp. Leaf58]|uniref:ammonia-dependent NAD(+) synthetase n=1 Tax=Pseudomonas sp. Leaf58 TaxID=1736226 RepID=UPI0006F65481|nr:ammonia-dependent NAD(+) synthetase [Pseudomonas sp. Leaf58]AYG48099.1 ammonia-dependent NAD(+) synthetase [Pseudomonas sp. Leaf58]KQN62347.1 NAD(+) synthetase [Pseudomonas sp. Leaf58]
MNIERENIIRELNVRALPSAVEIRQRVDFIKQQLTSSGLKALVLGISGGVDSLVAGTLAQQAATELRQEGYEARFIAMRLPYGEQKDEADAQACLAFIKPDVTLTVNIKPATDGMMETLVASEAFTSDAEQDFVKGNVKARQRMIAQYAVAGRHKGLVIGSDHASECVFGYYTKFGDGGCDIVPLSGLVKGQVREMATTLGAPERLVFKTPTADLEDLSPQKADEDAYGVTYQEIDAFLLGHEVSERAQDIILTAYEATRHKRALPYTIFDK